MKVAVGSENPVKIKEVSEVFKKAWPKNEWMVEGVKVASGVSDQPMSDAETIKGAKNRASRALKKIGADFGVGLEGGMQKIGNKWFDCGWMVIVDKKGNVGIGSSARMEVGRKIMRIIRQGKELGDVNDILFKKKNSKQAEGFFGIMTNGAVSRKEGYKHGVYFALARFLHPKIWE